jgi:hypothetical protein
MSYWNHRVVIKHDLFGVHEVYYDDNNEPEMVTQDPQEPLGETLEELREEIARFAKALDYPVLRYEDIGKDKKSKDKDPE